MTAVVVEVGERPAAGALTWVLGTVVALRLATLGLYPLSDTTEARYAEIARKMVELGDWVTPWYDYGVPFWAKPPLSTWLTAASFKVLGINEFAARLPHFLLAVFVAWLVWDWVRQRSAREAMIAVALLAGSALYFVAAGAVMTDIGLLAGTMLAMRGFWQGLHGNQLQRRREGYLLFIGLAIGLLAKGPIALVLAGLPIALWAMVTGNIGTAWRALPWLPGTLLMLVLSVPWYGLAELHTPGFLNYFLIGEHWRRFTEPGWAGDRYGSAHAVARGTIWLYAWAACLPWTLLLLFATLGRRKAIPHRVEVDDRAWRPYLLFWGLAPCVFFTVSRNIIWTYALPGLPALAMLAAAWLARDPRRRRIETLISCGLALTAVVFTGFLITEQLSGGFKSAKAVVAAYEARKGSDAALIFVGTHLYSPAFYSRGKAEQLKSVADLGERLRPDGPAHSDRGAAFVALQGGQSRELTRDVQQSLYFEGRFGAYELFSVRR